MGSGVAVTIWGEESAVCNRRMTIRVDGIKQAYLNREDGGKRCDFWRGLQENRRKGVKGRKSESRRESRYESRQSRMGERVR